MALLTASWVQVSCPISRLLPLPVSSRASSLLHGGTVGKRINPAKGKGPPGAGRAGLKLESVRVHGGGARLSRL
jgi:hypothetical protein